MEHVTHVDTTITTTTTTTPFTRVVLHPLVLLSVVDHYNRVAKDTNKRVVGILLGTVRRGTVDCLNSFAVPFDENANDNVWFLDNFFAESMYGMYRKVNAREVIVGWYSTGPKIRPVDIEINQLLSKFTPNPVFCIVDVSAEKSLELPIQAYVSVETVEEEVVGEDEKMPVTRMTFQHLTSDVGAVIAEQIGVEHLLRDIQDSTIGTVAQRIDHKLSSLRSLAKKIREIKSYLENVCEGRLPPNQRIFQQIQDIFNLSPAIQYAHAFTVKSNDMLLTIYLSSMVRAVVALHDLILNKLDYKEDERKAEEKKTKSAQKKETETSKNESK